MVVPKFRAWDKNTKKMNGMVEIYRNRKQEIELLPRDDNTILMQSTGLFDNSMPKKEIFENDIVEWEHKDTGQLVRGIVKYDAEFGFWGMTDVRFNDLRSIGYLANQKVTVLGDIYQNPELVEELE